MDTRIQECLQHPTRWEDLAKLCNKEPGARKVLQTYCPERLALYAIGFQCDDPRLNREYMLVPPLVFRDQHGSLPEGSENKAPTRYPRKCYVHPEQAPTADSPAPYWFYPLQREGSAAECEATALPERVAAAVTCLKQHYAWALIMMIAITCAQWGGWEVKRLFAQAGLDAIKDLDLGHQCKITMTTSAEVDYLTENALPHLPGLKKLDLSQWSELETADIERIRWAAPGIEIVTSLPSSDEYSYLI